MIVTFMTYSAVATTEENIFTVGGGAMMLLFLLSEGKLLSGAGGKKALRSTYVFGLPAAVLWMTYVLSLIHILKLKDGDFTYKLSILKSCEGNPDAPQSFFFDYTPVDGLGPVSYTHLEHRRLRLQCSDRYLRRHDRRRHR